MKVALINYGMGNLGSVRRALEELGSDVVITDNPENLNESSRIILPGVGAFREAMTRLRASGWVDVLRTQVFDLQKPILGVCLGMQLLTTSSEEDGLSEGLGFISGRVQRLDTLGCSLRVPHTGWNEVRHEAISPLFSGIPQGTDFYFVHSFAVVTDDPALVSATVDYGCVVTAALQRDHVFGTQFHPEKSSKAGKHVLRNFLDYRPC